MKKQTKVDLVTRTNFAKMAGVGLTAISEAVKSGALAKAMVGKKLDANHPDAVLYLQRNKARLEAKKRRNQDNIGNKVLTEKLDNKVEEFMDLTLREVIEFFGTDEKFSEWLRAAKTIEDIREKQLKNRVTQGELIPRELVRTSVFAYLEILNLRLLGDSPRTITARVKESLEAGESREKIEKLVGELIGIQLKGAQLRIRRSLRE
jgi:hypothetical protein